RVLLVTLAAMGITLLLVGLVPALQVSRPELSHSLKLGSGGGGLGGDRRQRRLRTGLLLAQATLSVLLLVGAGLFVRSFQRASSLDLGFDASGVIVAQIDLGLADYSRERTHQFFGEARDRMAVFPGVERASIAMMAPFWTRFTKEVRIPGRDSLPRFPGGAPRVDAVSPEHFATLGIRVRQGRGFTTQDRSGSAPVVIVNETMAKAYWPGGTAVGRCMKVGADSTPCREVVGVVDDVRFEDLVEPPTGRFWVPLDQSQGLASDRILYLKVKGDPGRLVAGVRRALQSMAPNLPRANVRPLTTHLDPLLQPWRLGATMFGLFGVLALLVSVVGLYSVLAYGVAQRTQEFGVRLALGASAAQLRGLVLRQGLGVVLAGLAIGVGLALLASDWLAPLLFQTSGHDPLVFGGVSVILLSAAGLACIAPAERAVRVNPMEALRSE
ncbi:MAG: FtsX-like permease family protein, partial [Gemmatimonadota bacterium]